MIDPARHIDDTERRARLATRHGFAPSLRAPGVREATEAVVCLHATEPANVYLSLVARAEVSMADIDAALYDERSIVKQLAMRRTVFAFPRALLPAVRGSAAARVADRLATRLAKEVADNGLASDGAAWVREACEAVRVEVAAEPCTTAQLRARIPALDLRLEIAPDKSYGGSFPIAPRLLAVLAADGSVVRGRNAAGWKVSRPYWTAADDWLGHPPTSLPEPEGYATLVGAWLARFGPGTEDDLVWWLGATKGAVRAALRTLEAVAVTVDGSGLGWVLPDDVEPVAAPEPWVALLPVLDPTTMGWKGRDFYLGGHAAQIVDRAGNAGATAWADGRIVGGWGQRDDGTVTVLPLEKLSRMQTAALDAEAARLTEWLGGDVVRSIYTSPQVRAWAAAASEATALDL